MNPRELTYRRASSACPRVELERRGRPHRAARAAPGRAPAPPRRRSSPRTLAIAAARTTSVVTWVTNVLDAATAISGPAWRNRTASASRVIAEPTVFVTAMIGQPCSRASRVGAIVSAVSPDWVTAMTSVVRVERRRAVAELRADRRPAPGARSSPGSRRPRPAPRRRRSRRRRARPASTARNVASRPSISATWIRPSRVTRPASDWRSASGCSWISLSMKCS